MTTTHNTVIHMKTALLSFGDMLSGMNTGNRERAYRSAVRSTLEAAQLPVTSIFAREMGQDDIPEVRPDGSIVEDTTYLTATVGVEIDAPPETIEQILPTLHVPGFPATAWNFPEE
ncbi:hypothetical protein [Rhodococcus qingshengii]|uniref:hypothetical protein n=1 Tax=Rhodococcus qingshengii TaxID=334542 RepID=UPI001A56BAD1|nr:hypothetical protein [Rhodococcus qingshengii]MCT6735351.1 hypothetical protein [Rhodococcus qingshengii]ULD39013.1 hypothetical protein JKI97_00385 [Rhodococcus qingshengii]